MVYTGNEMYNVQQSCLFGVKDAEFSDNEITITEPVSATSTISAVILNSCHNVNLYGNTFSLSRPTKGAAYPILIRQNTNRTSGKINIQGNTITSDTNIYLMIYEGFTGEVDADNNKATSATTSVPLQWVNNSKSKGIRVKDENMYK